MSANPSSVNRSQARREYPRPTAYVPATLSLQISIDFWVTGMETLVIEDLCRNDELTVEEMKATEGGFSWSALPTLAVTKIPPNPAGQPATGPTINVNPPI